MVSLPHLQGVKEHAHFFKSIAGQGCAIAAPVQPDSMHAMHAIAMQQFLNRVLVKPGWM